MPYLMSTEIQNFLDNSLDPFSVWHLNIITIIKKLLKTLNLINFTSGAICLSETWWDDLTAIEKSIIELLNYNSTHRARGSCKGGGVSLSLYIYIHKSMDFTMKPDLSIHKKDIESLIISYIFNYCSLQTIRSNRIIWKNFKQHINVSF